MGHQITEFLLRHGYGVVFAWVFAEQIGIPVPALPLLLAAGASAGRGHLSFSLLLVLATTAAALSDSIWYHIGRRKGSKVLNLLCRVSLEPDSCVRNTQNIFTRRGASSLLIAKFVPGLGTVSMPLAGIVRMSYLTFLAYELAGTLLWVVTLLSVGYIFSEQLDLMVDYVRSSGAPLLLVVTVAIGAWIGFKYYQRRRLFRKLRVARIYPQELKRLMDEGQSVIVVDLRNQLAFEAEPKRIPGAITLTPEDLEERNHERPREQDIFLYCT